MTYSTIIVAVKNVFINQENNVLCSKHFLNCSSFHMPSTLQWYASFNLTNLLYVRVAKWRVRKFPYNDRILSLPLVSIPIGVA